MSVYGIDLGTSFSKLARYDGEKCEALNVSGGIMSLMGDAKNLITAVFLQENGEFAVGQAAYNIRTLAPENYVCEFKRRLGTDTPYILGGKAYSTEDLYTQIFRRMRTIAAEAGEEIGHVVLTYPATYTQAKIDRLRRAANTAGLWSVEALDEPAAAAAFYAAENYLAAGERVLVYDFGGGTFDVSLVEKTKDGFRHLCASKGLADCGGADFDRLIFEDIKAKLLASPDVDGKRALEKPAILLHLAETAVKTKHQLSQAESYTEPISVGFDEFRYTLTRGGFEQMIAPYVARTLLKCKEAIAEVGLKERDITRVLPVGGTCSIPYIRRRLEESFPAAVVARVPNPGLMVCQGAARAAFPPPPPPPPPPIPEPNSETVTGVAAEILSGKKNVRFGEYNWRVLDIQDGRALLLTEDIIEERRYHSNLKNTTWRTCELRGYLNGDFLGKFDNQDRERILQANLSNPDNQWYGTAGGGGTTDKIFLLSIEEAVKYFGDSGQLKSRPEENSQWIDDEFNNKRTAKFGNTTWWWWLRSPGNESNDAAFVDEYGYLDLDGNGLRLDEGGVRPALWLKMSEQNPEPEPVPPFSHHLVDWDSIKAYDCSVTEKKAYEHLLKFAKFDEWTDLSSYSTNEDNVIQVEYTLDNLKDTCLALIVSSSFFYSFGVQYPAKVTRNVAAMYKLVTLINYDLPLSFIRFNPKNGQIYAHYTFSFRDELPQFEEMKKCIESCVWLLDKYAPAIRGVLENAMDPVSAIKLVEG